MTPEERADEIVGRCRERLDGGEAVDLDEIVRAHPEIAATLRHRFAAFSLLDRTFARAGDASALAGRRLGPYRLIDEIGSGGMGAVWLAAVEGEAEGLAAGARVAVKVVHPHLAGREGYVARFVREAELGRRVRHENVVATLGAGADVVDGRTVHWLAMEFVEGRTLRALADESRGGETVREVGPARSRRHGLPEELCRRIGADVAKGLAAIHAAGAVHRDLKPENVVVTGNHAVKVMDLGVARVLDDVSRLSHTGAFVGSMRYAAPEQLRNDDEIDGRADLHALGLVLYELATGRHAFGDEFAVVVKRLLDERPRRLGLVDPQVSPFFEELVARLLEKDRELRPASAAEVASILADGEESAWWRDRAKAIRGQTRRPLRRMRMPRETSLHGRDAELASLRAVYDKAKTGDGQVVLVEGEAGIGKSRLVDEFATSLADAGEDVDFLFGSYPPGGAATASGAFATAYREHLGDDESAVRDMLPETPLLAPAFAALLRGDLAPADTPKLTKDSLQTMFVHAMRSFAARRTTIVFIDDLHFAPPEGLGLFAALALAAPGHRVLLVGGARPSLDEKWIAGLSQRGRLVRLPLSRLGVKHLVALLQDAVKSRHVAEELAGKIGAKSDGNPFFALEILGGLREGRFLTRKEDGTWITTKEIREVQVPSSIVDVVQARVSELERGDRDVLEAAACAGFEFDAALVGNVLRAEPIPLLQRLGAIEKRHRLVRSVGRRFVFDHHQVQEVLYAGLSPPLREAYHVAIGEVIETRHGAAAKAPALTDGAVCVQLAEQFLRGAAGPRALRYLDAAVAHLRTSYLSDAVVRLTDRALAAEGLLAGMRRFEALLGKLDCLDVLGRRDETVETLREMTALAGTDDALRARALLASSRYLVVTSRLAEACRVLEEAIPLFRTTGERAHEAKAVTTLGETLRSLGRLAESRPLIESGLAASRELGDRRGITHGTEALAITFIELGLYDEATRHIEAVRAMHHAAGDRRSEAGVTGYLGNVRYAQGRHEEAVACHERHASVAREFGDRAGESSAVGNLANALNALGRISEARVQYERQHAISREIGNRRAEAISLVNLGPLWAQLGRPDRARESLTAALALCREIGLRYPEGYALHFLAEVVDEEGDVLGGLRLLEEALAVRRSVGHAGGVEESLAAIGEVRLRLGDVEGARAALAESVASSRKAGRRATTLLGLVILACVPGSDAAAEALALLASDPGLDSVVVRRFLWQATGDRAHLLEAKRLLDRLVANAPADCRESIVANVRLHREIADAAQRDG